MVPLREWRIPTLIVLPAAVEAVELVEVGEGVVAVDVVVVSAGGVVQAFRKRLVPRVAEPYRRNLRRPNRLAMPFTP